MMRGWYRRAAGRGGGFGLPRRAAAPLFPDKPAVPGKPAETDHVSTIARAVRALRYRYVGVTIAFMALCTLILFVGHAGNTRFSNVTEMAVLVAEATEVTDKIRTTAGEMSRNAEAAWGEKTLMYQVERLDRVLGGIDRLWQQLPPDVAGKLIIYLPYGQQKPMEVLTEFRNAVAHAAEADPLLRQKTGSELEGLVNFQVAPAFAQLATALRNFNRDMADRLRMVVNSLGAVLTLFAAGMMFGIFLPMDRSIRAALAKLRTALEAAKTSERAKSEFLANMSHEIRTPMNGVLGMAELMAGTELDARQRTFTDVIVKSGNALLTIINDILDFSKIDAGHIELDPAPFNLREAVEDVATLVSSRVAEKDLELVVRVDPAMPDWIVGDVGRIRQILTNLTGNAVKFTENGHVLVEVLQDGGDVLFRVEDTGIGIPADKLASVFDKFSQVDNSSTRRHEGTGLGLAIASRLVELMGGSVGAESVFGKGSTFWFRFPLAAHAPLQADPQPAAELAGARLLVVDDNAINRAILVEMTRKWGFDVCAVESGRIALEFLDHAERIGAAVDLVVLDYQMPGLTGADVAAGIRSRLAWAGLPVVLLTSVDHRGAVRELKSAGATAILTKPARSALLLTTLVEVLSGRAPARAARPVAMPVPLPALVASRPDLPALPRATTLPAVDGAEILVAEDNEVNQLVFTQILEQLGHGFHIVGDGRRAVEAWRRLSPRIILMDVSMPDMNGLEAAAAIRAAEAAEGLARTPIIGVTAHALKGDRERCLEAGMDDYLTKPVSPQRIAAKLTEWMPAEPVALSA
jgi:signal transduction histidine kinase/DNA-binding response OmpR family regulator